MTTDKARKRAVRSRMAKTGERYAAARRHVVADTPAPEAAEPAPPPTADPGVNEASIRRKTGRGWEEWLKILDEWGAPERPHREIARHLVDEHGVPGWWAQWVTVGYERARGLRARHQTARGFEVSVSKTLPVTPDVVWPWIAEERGRDAWLEAGRVAVRSQRPERWLRCAIGGEDGDIRIQLDAKGDDRSVVTVTHSKLAGAEAVAETRIAWRARLGDLLRAVTDQRALDGTAHVAIE
jgi:hypothetical protein